MAEEVSESDALPIYHVVRCPNCRKVSIVSGYEFKCECTEHQINVQIRDHCLNHSRHLDRMEKLLKMVKKHDSTQ